MKYTENQLKNKTKKELINIILTAQIFFGIETKDSLNDVINCIVADGTQGMRRGV